MRIIRREQLENIESSAKHNVCAGGTVCINLFGGFAYNQIQIQLPVEVGEHKTILPKDSISELNQWSSLDEVFNSLM